jgi:hypothetical protein
MHSFVWVAFSSVLLLYDAIRCRYAIFLSEEEHARYNLCHPPDSRSCTWASGKRPPPLVNPEVLESAAKGR